VAAALLMCVGSFQSLVLVSVGLWSRGNDLVDQDNVQIVKRFETLILVADFDLSLDAIVMVSIRP